MHTTTTPTARPTSRRRQPDRGPARLEARRRRPHRLAAAAAGLVALTSGAWPAVGDADTGPPDAHRDAAVIAAWNAVAMDVLTSSGRPLLAQRVVSFNLSRNFRLLPD
jgi:hypothetical protein